MGFSNVRLADYKHNNAGFGISAGKLGSIVIENCKLKIPVPRSGIWPAPVAQLVEQLPLKELVLSSSLSGGTSIKLSGTLPIDSAARSAAENGNTGSPRTARLAKRRFEIPCDFKYLLCPKKNFCYNKNVPNRQSCLFQWPSRSIQGNLDWVQPGRPFKF